MHIHGHTLQAEGKGEVGTTGAEGDLMKKAPKTFSAGRPGTVTSMLYKHEALRMACVLS